MIDQDEYRARRTKYQRDWRARKRERESAERESSEETPKVTYLHALPPPESDQVRTTVTQAVESEIGRLPMASRHEADVENALRMAAILDNPKAWTQWCQASSRLKVLMDSLRVGEANVESRLAQFRASRSTG